MGLYGDGVPKPGHNYEEKVLSLVPSNRAPDTCEICRRPSPEDLGVHAEAEGGRSYAQVPDNIGLYRG